VLAGDKGRRSWGSGGPAGAGTTSLRAVAFGARTPKYLSR
jgi:hypothetical protein